MNKAWNSTFKAPTKSMRSGSTLKRSAFKRSAPKRRAGHDKAVTELCKTQPCYLRIPGVCMGAAGKGTVVPCHSNQAKHGKGMGIKADDYYTVPGCFMCHRWIDQGSAAKEIKFKYWDDAFSRWEPVRRKKENPATAVTVLGAIQQSEAIEC